MQVELTKEEEIAIKDQLRCMHAKLHCSHETIRSCLKRVQDKAEAKEAAEAEEAVLTPPSEEGVEEVEDWLRTGKWNHLRKTARHAVSTGLAKVGL
jgi:hypothetical protein